MHDTLLKLCYHYMVSKKEVQFFNKFSGDDIFFMKEILIPVNEKNDVARSMPKISKKQQEVDEKQRREVCI